MHIALIIAGGLGTRFGTDVPKQFVKVNNKPILLYTLCRFEKAACIDKVILVCVDGWIDYVERMKAEYHLTKIDGIIKGGNSRFKSIFYGISYCAKRYDEQDILVIHDSVRPFITEGILDNNIMAAKKYGASLTVDPCFDTMFVSDDGKQINSIYPREKLFKGQTPESINLGMALKLYNEAYNEGLEIDSPTALLVHFGLKVSLSQGSPMNIKVTTKEDIRIFKSLLSERLV